MNFAVFLALWIPAMVVSCFGWVRLIGWWDTRCTRRKWAARSMWPTELTYDDRAWLSRNYDLANGRQDA